MAFAFGGFDILVDQQGFDVLVYRQLVDQVVCLEHKTDVLFVESGTLLFPSAYAPVHKRTLVFAFIEFIEHTNYIQQG